MQEYGGVLAQVICSTLVFLCCRDGALGITLLAGEELSGLAPLS